MASPMARLQQKKQAAVTTGQAGSTGTPCAMVLQLIRDLPGVPGLIAPSPLRGSPSRLDASVGASGPRDFAVRLDALRLVHTDASIASRATFRDDRDTPS